MGEGPDVCLGLLPGVAHACCGHGDMDRAYAVLGGQENESCLSIDNGVMLYGEFAHEFFSLVRMGIPIVNGERLDRKLPDIVSAEAKRIPQEGCMSIDEQAKRVYRAVLKKKALTAGEIATKAGFASGRGISQALSILVSDGFIQRVGHHSGNTRPAYIKAS